MSWAARRVTTRPEDNAYCLMGLFSVNMPLLYGEGEKAFLRLQEMIIKDIDDHSIFAWPMGTVKFPGLLAPTPAYFSGCNNIVSSIFDEEREPFSMTNRGLSIKVEITPWLADTYLAYLDCAKRPKSDQHLRMGIFLRRLTENNQYVRVKFPDKGLWLDTEHIYHEEDRPKWQRQLFVRQNLNYDREIECLKDRVYGFKISDGWLPPSTRVSAVGFSEKDRTTYLPNGGWGCAMVIDVSVESKGLGKIVLGFDLEFHPICLVMESSSHQNQPDIKPGRFYDWPYILSDEMEWDEIIEGSRVYRRMNHDGIWAVRGHRLRGLDVLLSNSFTDEGSIVVLERDKSSSQLVWGLNVDHLVDPFRNNQSRPPESSFADRRNFQAPFEPGLPDDGSDEGDERLEAMLDPA